MIYFYSVWRCFVSFLIFVIGKPHIIKSLSFQKSWGQINQRLRLIDMKNITIRLHSLSVVLFHIQRFFFSSIFVTKIFDKHFGKRTHVDRNIRFQWRSLFTFTCFSLSVFCWPYFLMLLSACHIYCWPDERILMGIFVFSLWFNSRKRWKYIRLFITVTQLYPWKRAKMNNKSIWTNECKDKE